MKYEQRQIGTRDTQAANKNKCSLYGHFCQPLPLKPCHSEYLYFEIKAICKYTNYNLQFTLKLQSHFVLRKRIMIKTKIAH